jgi:hypothetical protein
MGWIDSLLSALGTAGRGIGSGLSTVGKTIADPFITTDEEKKKQLLALLSASGVDPGQEMSGLGDRYTPNFPSTTPGLDTLASIGKGIGTGAKIGGTVLDQIGRMLPGNIGPLFQAGEYGVLKATGKTDTPFAQGNMLVQRDKALAEQQALRDYQTKLRAGNLEKLPYEIQGAKLDVTQKESDIEKNKADLANAQFDLKDKEDKKAALIATGGYTGQFERDIEKDNADIARLKGQLSAAEAQRQESLAGVGLAGTQAETSLVARQTYLSNAAVEYAKSVVGVGPNDAVPAKDRTAYVNAYNEYMQNADKSFIPMKVPPEVVQPTTATTPGGLKNTGNLPSQWLGQISHAFDPNPNMLAGTPNSTFSPDVINADDQAQIDEMIARFGLDETIRRNVQLAKSGNQEAVKALKYLLKRKLASTGAVAPTGQ